MKCPDHFFDVRKNLLSDGVKNNNEETFSAAHFLHKFSFPRLAFCPRTIVMGLRSAALWAAGELC